MSNALTVHGYKHSVYTRCVLLALAEKDVSFRFAPCDPFDPDTADNCQAQHPFGRVPALNHNGVAIYETAAILRYIDAAFPSPPLTPKGAKPAARMAQVMGIIDAYGYWPMVRQVFAHEVFRPWEGLETDTETVAQGLRESAPVLTALDDIATEGLVLSGAHPTLADCHLAPMMAAFTATSQGAEMVRAQPALSAWWSKWARRASMRQTDTGFDRADATGF